MVRDRRRMITRQCLSPGFQPRSRITDWKALRNAAVKKQAGQAVQAQAIANGAKTRLDALSDEYQSIREVSIATPPNTLPSPGPINRRKASGELSSTPSARECNRVVSQYRESVGTLSPPAARPSRKKYPK